ncbi:hypothetical protein SMD11_2311 [Streptomyces albireticuli]|uniref:Uncharacterized protein n=1 Tax=Streptomyces albireticuli TaxID=1940 RepID=A0A1Z2L0Y1_9ACTN|nr:DUF6415 family natural product biosynthesis protein [Streptomyces albireticuli]ARZ67962.1 hypothetical protein SMD11_2311 [Streptomyces albireticuli]
MDQHTTRRPSRLTTLMTGDLPPLDLVTVRATAHRACRERLNRPANAEIEELIRTLRGQLNLLLIHAQLEVDRLDRGTVEWDRWQALIDQVRADLKHGSAEGPAAEAAYMEVLGRGARFLAECLER